jgi:1-hydroxycarotenoid 3,4-desaturase
VVVVGAGIGGLVAAVELAAAGREVVVLERAGVVGGKIGEAELAPGLRVSTGPALLTLRDVFDEVFAAAGSSLADEVPMRRVEHLGRHLWPDGSALDLPPGAQAGADAVGRFAGAAAARGYLELLARARRVFEALERPFLRAERPTALGLAAEVGMARLMSLSPFGLLADAVASHLRDPRLRQAMGRFATYVGGAPSLAPATLLLVAHVEQLGLWRVEGGMVRLAEALARLAQRHGAEIRLGAEVRGLEMERGRVAAVRLAEEERVEAAAVIANAEAGALGEAAAPRPSRRSFSAFTWAMLAEAPAGLAGQTTVHPDPARGEFAEIALRQRLPVASTITLFAEDRLEGREASAERLLASISAPAAAGLPDPTERSFAQLAAAGVALRPQALVTTTPAGFAARFPGSGGAIYGPAPQGWSSAFERPGARTARPGLFLAGGHTHPGSGVAMAAISGRLAARAVMRDAT